MAIFAHITPLILLLLLLSPLLVKSQTNSSISLNSSLTASETQQFSSSWKSPSGDFAFGFRKIEPNEDFLLAIWFDKIQGKTIVWHAYADSPVPEGSRITLTRDRGLVLTNPQGNQIWRSEFPSGSVSRGFMRDTGNFVVKNENSDNVWSSFANPTDTLLPNQIMEVNGLLSSRWSYTNFTKGRFQLRLLGDGNLVLNTINKVGDAYSAYYISGTYDPENKSNSGYRLIFNQSGDMFILRRNNETFGLNVGDPVSSDQYYHRAILHFDGVFAQYYYPKSQSNGSNNNTAWSQAWAKPNDICVKDLGLITPDQGLGSQACGYNSICTLGSMRRPSCKCPEGFSLVDENNEYGDCKPDFGMYPCGLNDGGGGENRSVEDLYDFVRLVDTDWPTSDYERYKNYDEESCKSSCLQDCLCAAVIFRQGTCWKKKFPLSNGRQDVSVNSRAYIKVPKDKSAWRVNNPIEIPSVNKKNRNGLIIGGSVLLGTSGFINFVLIAFLIGTPICMCKKRRKTRFRGETEVGQSNLHVFTYKELMAATGEFEEELGRGAFGIVYKGVVKAGGVADNNIDVAVKKLDRIVQEKEKEFKNEVSIIGQTHHKNLVKLIGFCNEGQNRLLVYEFLPHGTLANFLFRDPKPSWKERKIIATGIARGILYLHEECNSQIIHCDIKPQNILLDEYYNAKISDFGLAKLLMMNQTHTHTGIRGTKGYVAPEWFRNNPITTKVDVFSYGVLLLEIVCCKKAVDFEDNVILTDWTYDCFRQKRLLDLIEGDLEAIEDMETVERYIKTAIWCIQEEPGKRPNMRKVAQMLEGVAEVAVPPNPSPYGDFNDTTGHISVGA